MTNKEWYQRTFSAVRSSRDYLTEVTNMKRTHILPRTLAACLAAVLLIGASTIAYAADVGGIQRQIQIWRNGEQTDAVLEIPGDGTYQVTDPEDGEIIQAGGGVAFNPDGSQRPLTEEELMKELNMPDVRYPEDGTVVLTYLGQVLDITDKFDEDGVCYVTLVADGKPLYVTVMYQNGLAASPNKYIQPWAFN